MLLLILIAVSLLASSFTVAEEDCSGHVSVVCAPRLEQLGFPETPEVFKAACRALIDSFECSVDYERQCNTEPGMLPKAVKVLDVLKEVCNESTSLHAAIADNLVCLKNHVTSHRRNFACEYPDPDMLKKQATLLEEQGLDPSSKPGVPELACMIDLYYAACQEMHLLENCGEDALYAYLKILSIFSDHFFERSTCSGDVVELLAAMIRLQRLEKQVEEILEREK